MPPRSFLPLGQSEKQWLAEFIHRLLPVAADPQHPMSRVATTQIGLTMWRWTADGINSVGHAVPDSIKYDARLLPATRDAKQLLAQGKRKLVRHEHVVPRSLLTHRLIALQADALDTQEILERLCRAALVSVEENGRLRARSMPPEWRWDSGDVWARYREVGLFELIDNTDKP